MTAGHEGETGTLGGHGRPENKRTSCDPEEGVRLVTAFRQIEHPEVRHILVDLAEALARVKPTQPTE